MAGVYHSGWPTTVVEGKLVGGVFHTVLGPLNSERLPAYRRVDVRASRNIQTSRGGFSFFVELFNALGIQNVTGVDGYHFTVTAGQVSMRTAAHRIRDRRRAFIRHHVHVLRRHQRAQSRYPSSPCLLVLPMLGARRRVALPPGAPTFDARSSASSSRTARRAITPTTSRRSR